MKRKGNVRSDRGTLQRTSDELGRRFQQLAERWKSESAHLSSLVEMAILPSYQQIIGIGPEAIPLILQELDSDPDWWFWALQSITGTDPVPEDRRGRLPEMTEVWLNWGRENGYL